MNLSSRPINESAFALEYLVSQISRHPLRGIL